MSDLKTCRACGDFVTVPEIERADGLCEACAFVWVSVIKTVATWQAENGPLRDDAHGRAMLEEKTAQVQTDLVRLGLASDKTPRLGVRWISEGGRSEPVFYWKSRELTPDEMKRREEAIAKIRSDLPPPALDEMLSKIAHDAVKEVLRKLEPEIGILVERGAQKIHVLAWLENSQPGHAQLVVKGAAVEHITENEYTLPAPHGRILDRVLDVTDAVREHYKRRAASAEQSS